MNGERIIPRVPTGEAEGCGYVNFETKITRGLDQLHSISAKTIQAIVDEDDSGLGLHAWGLHTVEGTVKRFFGNDGLLRAATVMTGRICFHACWIMNSDSLQKLQAWPVKFFDGRTFGLRHSDIKIDIAGQTASR